LTLVGSLHFLDKVERWPDGEDYVQELLSRASDIFAIKAVQDALLLEVLESVLDSVDCGALPGVFIQEAAVALNRGVVNAERFTKSARVNLGTTYTLCKTFRRIRQHTPWDRRLEEPACR
jgi:hypothetical protein